jgi:hypothetical protein
MPPSYQDRLVKCTWPRMRGVFSTSAATQGPTTLEVSHDFSDISPSGELMALTIFRACGLVCLFLSLTACASTRSSIPTESPATSLVESPSEQLARAVSESKITAARKLPQESETARSKVRDLARVLERYTSASDALRTASRYFEHTTDPELWAAMTIVESECKSVAVSNKGAQGKLQVMPWWKRERGFEFYRGETSHLDDDLNFRAAFKIFQRILVENRGDKWRAVERYCGLGTAARKHSKKVQDVYIRIKKTMSRMPTKTLRTDLASE